MRSVLDCSGSDETDPKAEVPRTDNNPMILLMEEILHQLIGRLSHYLQGFIHPRWCRISAINSRMAWMPTFVFFCGSWTFALQTLQKFYPFFFHAKDGLRLRYRYLRPTIQKFLQSYAFYGQTPLLFNWGQGQSSRKQSFLTGWWHKQGPNIYPPTS